MDQKKSREDSWKKGKGVIVEKPWIAKKSLGCFCPRDGRNGNSNNHRRIQNAHKEIFTWMEYY